MTLKDDYNRIMHEYIKQFEQKHEIEFEGWAGNRVGEIAAFGEMVVC